MIKTHDISKKFVFVIMPFDKKFKNIYDFVIKPLEKEFNILIAKADELPFNTRMIYEQIISSIDSSDFIIADLSELNPNVFYELGYAHARNKIVIPISQEKLPFDVAGFRTNFYDNNDLSGLKEQLISSVNNVIQTLDESRNKNYDPIINQYKESIEIVRTYAQKKAVDNDWKRPGMYFTEEQLIEEMKIKKESVYTILNFLREQGYIGAVNWKGDTVWTASLKLKEL